MKKSVLCLLAALTVLSCAPVNVGELENEYLRLRFSEKDGSLISLFNVKEGVEHLDSALADAHPLWRIECLPGSGTIINLPTEVSFKKKNSNELEILWKQPKNLDGPSIKATVRLKKDRPYLADWDITISGIKGLDVCTIQYPIIGGIRPLGEEDAFIRADWTGLLIRNPWEYVKNGHSVAKRSENPGRQGMQFNAFYNKDKSGIFIGTEDVGMYHKVYGYEFQTNEACVYNEHYLRMDVDTLSYSPPYSSVVGTFKGDWFSAAQIYRKWALKQRWCKDSRFKNGQVPEWALQTALWIWNRGRSGNVLSEAEALQNALGLPVSAWWHWWHNCAYDDGFPEYYPPREGSESFRQAIEESKSKGIHCLPYLNSIQWGDGTLSWKEKHAEDFCAIKADGTTYARVYNVFTKKSITPMCLGTSFWRDYYTDLCDTLVNTYGASGVYVDQACHSRACYNPNHSHSVGGGNSWVTGHLSMLEQIRKRLSSSVDNGPVLAGEGSCENWIGHLDLALTIQAGNERMSNAIFERIPLFNAVYHEYAVTFGNYSMLVYPPYDEKWPQEYRPDDVEKPFPSTLDRQFLMEQARTFVWGVQPCIANFHSFLFKEKPQAMEFAINLAKTRYQGLDFLLYGQMQRCPEIPDYPISVTVSKVGTYVQKEDRLKTNTRTYPSIYKGAWKASDGRIGIALANIGDVDRELDFVFDPTLYGLPQQGEIKVISSDKTVALLQGYDGVTDIHYNIALRSTVILVFQ